MRSEATNSENAESRPMSTETEQLSDIDELRREIDRLDAEILAAVKRRTEVSQAIGKVRMASGGTRLVHSREMKVIERYSELGPDGKDLAMLLLRMGRGRLGH
ncbi:chorismate mutase [Mycobacterium kyorinense]|nr:chorismate mutase [Mycobacterium kyorinense]